MGTVIVLKNCGMSGIYKDLKCVGIVVVVIVVIIIIVIGGGRSMELPCVVSKYYLSCAGV